MQFYYIKKKVFLVSTAVSFRFSHLKLVCFSGFVPNDGQFPMATGSNADLMVSGPLCRYIEDIMPMLKIMAGPDNKLVDLDKKVKKSRP